MKKKSEKQSEGILIVSENRKARRDYEILEKHEAGMVLLGSEVKSIRAREINLQDSYVRSKGEELYLVGCHIKPYKFSREDEFKPTRERKLLMHRREITKLLAMITKKGLTLVALKVYFRDGRCKVELALGRGKKTYDKREDVKKREAIRAIERGIKSKR